MLCRYHHRIVLYFTFQLCATLPAKHLSYRCHHKCGCPSRRPSTCPHLFCPRLSLQCRLSNGGRPCLPQPRPLPTSSCQASASVDWRYTVTVRYFFFGDSRLAAHRGCLSECSLPVRPRTGSVCDAVRPRNIELRWCAPRLALGCRLCVPLCRRCRVCGVRIRRRRGSAIAGGTVLHQP